MSEITISEITNQECHRCHQRVKLSRSAYTVGFFIIHLDCRTCQEKRWASYNFKAKKGPMTDFQKDLIKIEIRDLGLDVPETLPEIQEEHSENQRALLAAPLLERAPEPPPPPAISSSGALGSTPAPRPLSLHTTGPDTAPLLQPPQQLLPQQVELQNAEVDNPKVFLGEILRLFNNFENLPIDEALPPNQACWEPNHLEKPLNNFGILVTGDSGSGKSQLIRAIISELSKQRVPICIFDFKNDYSDTQFLSQTNLKVYDLNRDGMPFNPLQLVPNEDGECQPIRQVHEFSSILGRILNLGDQQEARLKRALIILYENNGIDPRAIHRFSNLKSKRIPYFSQIYNLLKQDPENEPLLNRLSYLLDLNLFPNSESTKTTFENLIQDQVSLDFHKLPDDRIKAILAEFLIVRLHNYVIKRNQPRKLRHLLVFDEAWRVKESERLQELAREGRAFGIGLTIGTQYPGDLPESLSGSLATQVFLHNRESDHQKHIAKSLCGSASNNAAIMIMELISKLQKHEGLLKNQQYSPGVLVRTIPHYKRV